METKRIDYKALCVKPRLKWNHCRKTTSYAGLYTGRERGGTPGVPRGVHKGAQGCHRAAGQGVLGTIGLTRKLAKRNGTTTTTVSALENWAVLDRLLKTRFGWMETD